MLHFALSGLFCLVVVSDALAAGINTSRSNARSATMAAKVTTATARMMGPGDTQTVRRTSATGETLITQFCASNVSGGVVLAVEGLGPVAETGAGQHCITFTPGLSVPQNAAITCSTSAAAPGGTAYFCTVNSLDK